MLLVYMIDDDVLICICCMMLRHWRGGFTRSTNGLGAVRGRNSGTGGLDNVPWSPWT